MKVLNWFKKKKRDTIQMLLVTTGGQSVRIIGSSVKIKNGKVYVDGKLLKETKWKD